MRKLLLGLMLLAGMSQMQAGKATWMWYPGDYEIWLANKMQLERTERNTFFPPFWRLYSHYNLVDFYKVLDLQEDEEVELFVEGRYNVKIDGDFVPGTPGKITLPAGARDIHIKVFSQDKVPAVYVKGPTVVSDTTWRVTYEDMEWIDESGKASDISVTDWVKVGTWNFDHPENIPSNFRLATEPMEAVARKEQERGELIDFGKETFGFLRFHGLEGAGRLRIYYGESEAEALSVAYCETLDDIQIGPDQAGELTLEGAKAFRYVYVVPDEGLRYQNVSMLYEYLPVEERGRFRCNDELINEIWDISSYTMQLTTREFFIDGIKRDRWIWSGDAYQSYLMNYYLYFDNASVERTLLAQRGKDPVTTHINTIMDYSFYWFMGIYDYYIFSGNADFVRRFYPRMVSLMDFVLERRNANGMMEGLPGDWVYVDWAPMSKEGELSFQQLLLARSLENMTEFARIAGDEEGLARYAAQAKELKGRLLSLFWDEKAGALAHHRVDGELRSDVTRYANMFAIFFDYLDEDKKQIVKEKVLLNDDVQAITTPYMRFYELEALCALGEQSYVLQEIRDYWGGMLDLGATSFWEKYDPEDEGDEHYAMYGRPFGKSLCHAWGASPIYLLGRYYVGVEPTSPGYETYSIQPRLGDLEWFEGEVPTPWGAVQLACDRKEMTVFSDGGLGKLRFRSSTKPAVKGAKISALGDDYYELLIEEKREYKIRYRYVD